VKPVVRLALDYFIGMGWSPPQAAGIVANLVAESRLIPSATGDSGLAYGIAQWHPDRQANFSAIMGKDIRGSSLEEQLAFVHAELQRWEKPAGDALASCATAREAGACVSLKYERPRDKEREARERGELAEQLHTEYLAATGAAPQTDEPAPAPVAQGDKSMGPLALLQLFSGFLGPLIPQITPLLNPGSKASQYAPIAQIVIDTIVGKTGASNLQGAVEAMQADPKLKLSVQQAVVSHPEVIGLMEIGGGIKAARESSVIMQNAERPFWFNPMFWVTAAFFPMMYVIIGAVLFTVDATSTSTPDAPFWRVVGFDQATRSGLVNLIVGMVFGGVVGVWFGTSYGSQRKTELAATEQVAAKQ